MRLKRVEIENFRLIERLELDLHPRMNVLIGANAAGKTTVLEAVAFSILQATRRLLPGAESGRLSVADIRRELGMQAEAASIRVVSEGFDWLVLIHNRENQPIEAPKAMIYDQGLSGEGALPLAIYYGTARALPHHIKITSSSDPGRINAPTGARSDAWIGAFSPHLNFSAFRDWFTEQSIAESLEHSRRKSFDVEIPTLKAVRDAVRTMIPGCTDLRLAGNPPRIQATMDRGDGSTEDVDFTELSDGYRTLLAVVADIARRMVQANPHQGLQSEALVMIDEIDLHLHPKWQQVVLASLLEAFPNAQFLVTTHSPQIIATADPEHLICLVRDGDGLSAVRPDSTYGALPDRILEDVMGLAHARPPEAAEKLGRYLELIALDQGEAAEALGLRAWLNDKFRGQEPELVRADLEIRRRKLMAARSA